MWGRPGSFASPRTKPSTACGARCACATTTGRSRPRSLRLRTTKSLLTSCAPGPPPCPRGCASSTTCTTGKVSANERSHDDWAFAGPRCAGSTAAAADLSREHPASPSGPPPTTCYAEAVLSIERFRCDQGGEFDESAVERSGLRGVVGGLSAGSGCHTDVLYGRGHVLQSLRRGTGPAVQRAHGRLGGELVLLRRVPQRFALDQRQRLGFRLPRRHGPGSGRRLGRAQHLLLQ